MRSVIIFLLCVICISCTLKTKNQKTEAVSIAATYTKPEYKQSFVSVFDIVDDNAKPYDIYIKLQPHENNIYDLVVDMRLYNGAHFVSPNAKRDFKESLK